MENTISTDSQGPRAQSMDTGSRVLIIGLSILTMLVLVSTLAARLTGYSSSSIPDARIVEVRELGFRDLPGGVVEVFDWQTDHSIQRIPSGEGAFLRGVVRSLVRQRAGLASSTASMFTLSRYDDGRLVLADPETGESIDLVAFGSSNFAVFAELMAAPGAAGAIDDRW